MSVSSKLFQILHTYPISRGIVLYSITWPISSLVQQTMAGKSWDTYEWKEVAKFGIYGAFYLAPSLYCWVRFTSYLFPYTSLKTTLQKVVLEQITYGPSAISTFYIGMDLLDGKGLASGIAETKQKFIPTYLTGLCFWPVIQTINFSFVPEKNRVPFISICSLMWTIFLSHMRHIDDVQKENTHSL